jgi:hypothetical protein
METETTAGGQQGEMMAPLFSALGGLRMAYSSHLVLLREGLQRETLAPQREQRLASLLQLARTSQQSKKRLAVLHWAKALFGYRHPLFIETLIILAGNININFLFLWV